MTEENKNQTKIIIFSFIWLAAISVFFVSLGIRLNGESGYAVSFNTVRYEGVKEAIMSVAMYCAIDIAMFLLITISVKPLVSLSFASVIMMLRGLALGACATFCAENAVSAASVAMLISYAVISVLLLIYTVMVNRVNAGAGVRLVLYLLVTGTAVILRAIPMQLV